MSRISELVEEFAPHGVAYRRLGDVARIASARVDANGLDATNYVGVDNLLPNFGGRKDSEHGVNSSGAIKFEPGDLLIGNIRPYLKKVWLADREGGASPDVLTLSLLPEWREQIDPRFLYSIVASESFIKDMMKHAKGAKMPRGDKAATLKFQIPVPPAEVQREIVRIMETFRDLQGSLSAELKVRKEQRLALARILPDSELIQALSPLGVERVRIGEVAAQSIEPVGVQPDVTYVNLGVKWYGEGAFARESKPGSAIKGSVLYRVRPGQFVYNRMFVIEGSFGVITPDLTECVVSNEFPVYDLDETRILPGWLMLYLLDEYTLKRVAAEVTGVERGSTKSRRRWKEQQFEAFQIDLPSIEAQREMLRVLGAGVALESALRDELALRQQQYEYIHDQLLAFQEAAA